MRLLLSQLGREHEHIEINLIQGQSRTAEFLAKNPRGRVPILEVGTGQVITESNAILYYLARDTALLPSAPIAAAKVMQWMFFEQNTLEPPLAGARFLLRFNNKTPANESVKKRQSRAEKALLDMEIHLSVRNFFVGDTYTIADTALYGFTHVANEAEIALDGYPAIQAWLGRVRDQPGYVAMDPVTTMLAQ